MPLKFANNLWGPLEIPLINCKVKLTYNQIKYCVLSVCGNDNGNADANNIFSIEDKVICSYCHFFCKDNQKLSKLCSKRFER